MSILRPTQNILNPVPNDTNNYLVYSLSVLSLFLAAALWLYIRSLYPCLTTSELNMKENKLDQVYNKARSNVSLAHFGDELQEKARRLTALKNRASRIRSRDLNMDKTSQSLWKIYLGLHPSLVSDTVAWYKDAEDLEQDIRLLMESDTQYRSEVETSTPIDAANPSISLPHIVPVSSFHDDTSRRQHEGLSLVRRHRHRRPIMTPAS
ncbi:hypothetical protein Moror_1392 [Moniliophthora roreri MCA 2997]|uniref:Uncharacterized protein n=1 Tax=Moniliophthora roreri (strain MCA 2997) TaxID=1381753 RepID=V2W7S2_MONRO|nr:hypothetical protein Moror_1392 [Moniliophthora roreri MCA 2997]KAI3597619.1 hypothetical protein WG66_003147 [Moniliophthora roreri]